MNEFERGVHSSLLLLDRGRPVVVAVVVLVVRVVVVTVVIRVAVVVRVVVRGGAPARLRGGGDGGGATGRRRAAAAPAEAAQAVIVIVQDVDPVLLLLLVLILVLAGHRGRVSAALPLPVVVVVVVSGRAAVVSAPVQGAAQVVAEQQTRGGAGATAVVPAVGRLLQVLLLHLLLQEPAKEKTRNEKPTNQLKRALDWCECMNDDVTGQ